MRITMSRVMGATSAGLMAIALGACSSASGGDVAGADTLPAPTSGRASASAVSSDAVSELRDEFDDDSNGWALPPSKTGSTTMVDGDFVWESKVPGLRPHLIAATLGEAYDAGRLEMTDVEVQASVTPQQGAAAMAVFCREVPDVDADYQWYEFVVRDGYAAIRLADLSGNLEVLADTEDASLPLGETATIGATCVDGAGDTAVLTLSLDHEALLTAQVDDALGNGVAGLQAYDSDDRSADRFRIAWHDFSVAPALLVRRSGS